ncbi:MAG: glycosyltransferase family 2 protein [Rhodobacterales bacterium]|nr:glycosyltransferase family 2 protein [Rhodobacterales bacterium]
MKIAAITMVYRDYWALGQWYDHFSRHIGAQNLFVIAHGADPEIARICPQASIITIPRDDLAGFDRTRGNMLNAFQNGLLKIYDWVIRTDADELICLDPAHYSGFEQFFDQHPKARAVFSIGMDLFEKEDDPPFKGDMPLFSQRRAACLTGHYSKAWAVSGRVALVRHGVQVRPRKVQGFKFVLPRGVYLVHLKYANFAALEKSNTHRIEIANGDQKGLPGAMWKNAKADAQRFLRKSRAKMHEPWDQAIDYVYDELAESPVREPAKGLVRVQSMNFEFRTTLPDWFANPQNYIHKFQT